MDSMRGDDHAAVYDSVHLPSVTSASQVLEAVERDSLAVSKAMDEVFASLQHFVSNATLSTVDHMQCSADAASLLQAEASEAAAKGTRFVNDCLR
eukprot:TRINITY_DN1273_c0_g1_i2.p1 TRINITY_DN1273_c0_g1~~TRINITY_DN1273_c0_g1_i2.p1  ORF type:complete len:110 (-),score=14.78 TRINITY_DN1273_c0_g1_i2:367-651(-)